MKFWDFSSKVDFSVNSDPNGWGPHVGPTSGDNMPCRHPNFVQKHGELLILFYLGRLEVSCIIKGEFYKIMLTLRLFIFLLLYYKDFLVLTLHLGPQTLHGKSLTSLDS